MPTILSGLSEDSRDLVAKLRRRELEAILMDNNISYPEDPPAELSKTMIRSAGINAGQYFDEVGNFVWPDSWTQRKKEEPRKNPPSMKRPDLIKFCKEEGIEWSIKDKKVDLQRKVEEHLGMSHG